MVVTCKTCGVQADLPPDRMPPGWRVVQQADYLDDFYCGRH